MKLKALSAMLFSLMLVCGAATITNAQTDSEQKPKTTDKQKDADKDDDDDDESPEARARLMKEAKISIEQARRTALERVAGTIVEEEIEREKGRLIYSFEIRDADRKIQEVEIDAMTGALIGVEEDDDDDKKTAEPRDPAKNFFLKPENLQTSDR